MVYVSHTQQLMNVAYEGELSPGELELYAYERNKYAIDRLPV